MTDETRILAEYVASTTFESLPPEVPTRAKDLVIDLFGSIVRARAESESTPSLLGMLSTLNLDGAGSCSVPGDSRTYTPAIAALLNGALGHSLDFDDTHAESSLHPSAPVVPAAFAAGQQVGASGKDVLNAIVAGYEVCCRIGNALDPSAHYARGFHPTATAGVFGAAAAVARLYTLSAEEICSAFGIAASQGAGSLQFLLNGAWNKRYQVGAAAMNGVIAATLAKRGFRGAIEALEGEHGFLRAHSDNAAPARLIENLGQRYETMRIGVKPYPSCRYTHAALDGLIELRQVLRLEEFVRVEIGLHQNGIVLTSSPLEQKRRPRSIVDAQFSMPFVAAVAMHRGSFGWDDYVLVGDERIESLAQRVEVKRDPRVEGALHPFGATLRVRTPSDCIERIIRDPAGEPDSFPDKLRTRQKFIALSAPILRERASNLFDVLYGLDEVQDMRHCM